MRVLVVGGSVTGGGGVGGRQELAWPAHISQHALTVRFKNAVDPTYFLHCTEHYIDGAHDVVLFDLGPNLFDGKRSSGDMARLANKTRCIAQAGSVALIN